MNRLLTHSSIYTLLVLGLMPAMGRTEDSLKIVENPGGGEIVYGPLDQSGSPKEAMVYMLHQVHGHYGDKPKVGRFFGDKAGRTAAVFFNLDYKIKDGRPIAGFVIVSVSPDGKKSAAVLTDDADRFKKTFTPMLKRLNKAWSTETKPTGNVRMAPAEKLIQADFPDGSGSIGLPEGWRLSYAHQGTAQADGPNGEMILMENYLPVIDPSTPQGRNSVSRSMRIGKPLPGMYVAAVHSDDPGRILISISQQLAQKRGRQAPEIKIESVTRGTDGPSGDSAIIHGQVDRHDGKGPFQMEVQMMIGRPFDRAGSWGMVLYQINVPAALADKERSTMGAITQSYRVNAEVVKGEVAQSVKAINAYTAAVLQRGRDSEARTDAVLARARNASDASEKSVQGFCNNLLDQSVITDSNTGKHYTADNNVSTLLIEQHPERFQYVPLNNYLKGEDY